MQKKCKIALVGLGGYGGFYIRIMTQQLDSSSFELVGVIDPYAKAASSYATIVELNVPVFDTLQEFYKSGTADLVIVSTPVTLHKEHAMIALNNGSNVLCEKPIVPTLQDAQELYETAVRCGKILAIGFQWSFSEVMKKIKEDMAKGDFGKPLEFSTMVSWCRARDYYQKGWTGHVKSVKDGQWLLDSIVSNATAHYLHNMLFLLGDKPDSAMEIAQCDAAIYRANSIESFDTCFLRGKTENGVGISYCVAHPTYVNREPKLRYRFENADITMNVEDENSIVRAYFKDGTVREYGNPQTDADKAFKLTKTIAAINGEGEIPCNALTCIPHLRVSNALFDMVDIIDYPKELVHVDEDRNLIYVDGVYEALLECFEHSKLPSELGADFAKEETHMDLRGYNSFSGERLERAREEK